MLFSGRLPKSKWIVLCFVGALVLTRNVQLALAAALMYTLLFRGVVLQAQTQGKPKPQPSMRIDDALSVLGLKSNASRQDIQLAYRNLMKRNHPDQGGSAYIAARINEAKDVLLRTARA